LDTKIYLLVGLVSKWGSQAFGRCCQYFWYYKAVIACREI